MEHGGIIPHEQFSTGAGLLAMDSAQSACISSSLSSVFVDTPTFSTPVDKNSGKYFSESGLGEYTGAKKCTNFDRNDLCPSPCNHL